LSGSVQGSEWKDGISRLAPGHKIGKTKPLFKKIEADEKMLDEMLAQVRERMARTT
jgi:hypothetical protein